MKIYGFIYTDDEGLHCFYVGRTEDMKRRLGEHKRLVKNPDAKDAHLLKYVECRALEAKGIEWHMQELCDVGPGEYEIDSEKAMVIQMVLAGHKLTNMKHGDVTKSKDRKELEDMIAKGVRTTEDVKTYREAKEKESVEKQQARAAKLAAKIAEQERINKLQEEMRKRMTEREKQRAEARIAEAARLEAWNKEVMERRKVEAEKERLKKIREEQRALELAELRKQQQAQWEIDNAPLIEARKKRELQCAEEARLEKETKAGIQYMEQWKRSLYGIK